VTDLVPPARALAVAREAATAAGDEALAAFRSGLRARTKTGALDPVTDADLTAQAAALDACAAVPVDAVVAEEGEASAGGADPGPRPGPRADAPPDDGTAWVVDPIDGTTDFARGARTWACGVAYVVDGDPVAAAIDLPAFGEGYAAGVDEATRDGDRVTVSDRAAAAELIAAPVFGTDPRDRDAYRATVDAVLASLGDLRRPGSGLAALTAVAAGELDAAVSTVPLAPWDTVAGVHLVRRAGGTVTDPAGERWRHDADGLVATNSACHDAVCAAVDATRG
jgi:myo-inositol-1(or 4)-monophosphatase